MKVLIIEPMKTPYVKNINGSLNSMQKIVGGTIQAIYPFKNPEIALICNDDGKFIGLPLNRALYDENGKVYDIIAGTFFICSAPADNENFKGLTDEQIEIYRERFNDIEIYLRRSHLCNGVSLDSLQLSESYALSREFATQSKPGSVEKVAIIPYTVLKASDLKATASELVFYVLSIAYYIFVAMF